MKIIKDALILCVITVAAGLGLGAVYGVTKEPIEKVNYETQQNAYKTVFENASEFKDLPDFSSEEATKIAADNGYGDTIENCVQAVEADGSLLGYVITVVSHDGYAGDIKFSIGVQLDGTLNGYSITDINETAGLGMKAKEESFYSQFQDKQVEQFTVTKTGSADDSEIDAISGATITSSAVTNGVDAGLAYFRSLLETTGGELLNE
ncbi:electron transport complex protein RnfG [uncultured Roseburia sp.]|uniref:RnfABCDGE type electron transport complex subunit G n=1 Tax=Brotonthovivens ammoniilytica TaxID=2981725 RepID=UPI000822CE46|nr:RnfABCDGE type electron transport complex subunit G [Brotonthovivens ammoniilytica]SCI25494.1 electron transport complex protein RnfG [uncultured Roseburia sp.]